MTDEQKLIALKNDLIEKMNTASKDYLYEYIRNNESSECERNLVTQESLVYAFKYLLINHFPDLNISDLVDEAKKNGIQKTKENGYEPEEYMQTEIERLFIH